MRRLIVSSLAATLMLTSFAPLHAAAQWQSASSGQLKTVSSRDLKAMCLRLTPVRGHVPVTRQRAIQAVENIPVLKRYRKKVAIHESVVARVKAAEPILASNHHVMWVLVSHQSSHAELYFVDALTGKLVTYMTVGDGCHQ